MAFITFSGTMTSNIYNNIKDIFKEKEEVTKMNKLKRKSMEMLAKEAKLITQFNANSTCRLLGYQPQMPKGSEKLKKHD